MTAGQIQARVRAGAILLAIDPFDEIDIDRSISGHVGFSFGIHQCLGRPVEVEPA